MDKDSLFYELIMNQSVAPWERVLEIVFIYLPVIIH